MVHVIAASRPGYEKLPAILARQTGHEFYFVSKKEDLSIEWLNQIQPRYIFFPHWSYKIPREIYERFECIIFHMTDVPFGRGGSPLQNLIARGIYETKISALRCVEEYDAGPVYLKCPLSLHGTAEEIYMRAAAVVQDMILEIIQKQPQPVEQQGTVVYFQRRKPEDGDISRLDTLEKVFDYIRMLDAEGYPKAFLETKHFRFEFERASLKQGKIVADVTITKKEDQNESKK